MKQEEHAWLVDVFIEIQIYMKEHGLESNCAELQACRVTLERELGWNVVQFTPKDTAFDHTGAIVGGHASSQSPRES